MRRGRGTLHTGRWKTVLGTKEVAGTVDSGVSSLRGRRSGGCHPAGGDRGTREEAWVEGIQQEQEERRWWGQSGGDQKSEALSVEGARQGWQMQQDEKRCLPGEQGR